MSNEAYKGIFVFAQQVDGKLSNVALELIGKSKALAKDLNTDVTAVVLGNKIGNLPEQLGRYGADRVIIAEDPVLETYTTEPYAHVITEVVKKYKPEIVLYGATAIGRDLAPRISARVHTGLTADCTGLEIEEGTGNLLMTRPAFGGNIMATIACADFRPQMATVRPGVMQRLTPVEDAKPEVIAFSAPDLAQHVNVEVVEVIKKVSEKMDIQEATVLVSGGRGMGGPENFKLLEELAEVLGGTVSSSRTAVDAGWVEKDRQVGQTGKTVRPNLYIACGISGAIQHLAGMEESDVIIAINKDPSAPIFEVADYGVVGDALKVLPLFTEQVKKIKAEKSNA